MISMSTLDASALEIQAKVTKVAEDGKVEMTLPEGAMVAIGDKVRIEVRMPGLEPTSIKTRWTIKDLEDGKVKAAPDGTPTSMPDEGYSAFIKTLAGQPMTEKSRQAGEMAKDMVGEQGDAAKAGRDGSKSGDSDADKPSLTESRAAAPAASIPDIDKAEMRPAMPDEQSVETSASITEAEAEASDSKDKDPKTSSTKDMTATVETGSEPEVVVPGPKVEPSSDVQKQAASKEEQAVKALQASSALVASAGEEPDPGKAAQMAALSSDETDAMRAPATESRVDPSSQEASLRPALPVADPSAIHACDELAAHPFDPDAITKGVDYEKLDVEKVIEACKDAIGQFPKEARFYSQLTRGLHKARQLDKAFETTMKGAELGSAHSMAYLGVMYKLGDPVPKDLEQSLSWFEKAAENGNPGGMVFAAAMYRDGTGTPQDYKRAADLYRMAADLNVAEAMTGLAIFHDRGQGVEKLPERSASLLLKAMLGDDQEAQKLLFDAPGAISQETRKAIQSLLQDRGFYSGKIDGDFGPQTSRSLTLFKRRGKIGP